MVSGKGIEVIILGFLTSFIVVLLSTPALIKVAHMKNLVDIPGDARKIHTRTIPTIGGIIIFAATLFAYFLWYPFNNITEYSHLIHAINDFKYIGASMLILFFVGIKDDIIGTAPMKKLVGHIIVAFILVLMADIRITSLRGIFGIEEIPYFASVFLSVLTYTAVVNAFNLIDGVDGLAAGIGSISSMAFGWWFFEAGGIEMSILAFALSGALIGFLFFNFSPARIFMGDSGSLTIGLIISVLSIKLVEFDKSELPPWLFNMSKPVFVLTCLAYPLVDTFRIFIYRIITGVSPFQADRNHIHHRLIDIGLNHRKTVLAIYFYTIIMIFLKLFIRMETPSYSFLIFSIIAISLLQIPFFFSKKKNRIKADSDSSNNIISSGNGHNIISDVIEKKENLN